MNFLVAKMYGNNGTFYGDIKYRNSIQGTFFVIRGNTYW